MTKTMRERGRTLLRTIGVLMLAVIVLFAMAPINGGQAYAAAKTKAPKAPRSVKVTESAKDRSIKVSWKKYKKKTSVQVYLKAGKAKYKKVATTKKNVVTIRDLDANVKYRVKVRAKAGKRLSGFKASKKVVLFTNAGSGGNGEGDDNGGGNGNTDPADPTEPENGGNTGGGGAGGTSGGAGGGSGASGGAGGVGGGNASATTPVDKNAPIIASQTKLIDMGYAQYVAIAFADGFNAQNTTINVDGTDINTALTDVTDDGSIVKWEITALNPAKLTATSKIDASKTATVTLSDNKNPVKPTVQTAQTPADYIMGHAPVSVFDYYLTNYDTNGNIRKMPAKTTFRKDGKVTDNTIRSYAADAEMDASGKGEVVVMFNYNTAEDKAWFDAVPSTGALELVSNSEQMNTLNKQLLYTKDTAYPHGSGTVAAVKVPLGQSNFTNNGRYYIRTKSTGHQAALTAINVVNAVTPTMQLAENGAIVPGLNVHFYISNMVEGIQESIETVTLTDPTGKTETLTHIDDWFHFGNTGLFVLYNDTSRSDGTGINHLTMNGTYTVNIQAAGFKTFSESFVVSGASTTKPAAKKAKSKKTDLSNITFDAMSGATGAVSTSGSGGSGGSMVSANLLFNVDLLTNAQIMDNLGMNNTYATAITDRWLTEMIPDYIFYKDGETFYEYTGFRSAVNKAAVAKTYLPFAEYVKRADATTTSSRPSRVKAVLEDNMLGDITDQYLGDNAPLLTAESNEVVEGSAAVFTGDAKYINAITSVTKIKRGNLADQSVSFTKAGNLTIPYSALTFGTNTFLISAKGYLDNVVEVRYVRNLGDISLSLVNETAKTGDDVVIKADGEGVFLGGDLVINLILPDNTSKEVMTASQVSTSGNTYYTRNGETITIKRGFFKTPGQYTVTVSSSAYHESLQLTFTVVEKSQEEVEASLLTLSLPKSADKYTQYTSTYYRITFANNMYNLMGKSGTKIQKVTVNGVEYQVYHNSDYGFVLTDDAEGNSNNSLSFTSTAFTKDVNEIVIELDGYKPLVVKVSKAGQLVQ